MSKTKQKVLRGITQTQADEAFGRFAKADSRINEIMADIEQEATRYRERFAAELAELKAEKEETQEVLVTYAAENAQLFASKKSVEMTHGIIGYRLNPPSVKQFKGVKVETTVELMRKSKVLAPFVVEKTTYTIDKRALLDCTDQKVLSKLDGVFISIEQDETFYIEPKKEVA